jgi:prepilin-type N-terminal cleavage/methylation domain-containing protein
LATGAHKHGFTLLELMAVFAVIAMILAVAAPRLLPLATHFGHEGAARELAAFGESAIQYAQLNNEEVYVTFDLDEGTYWVEHWVVEDGEELDEAPVQDAAELQESVTAAMKDPLADDEQRAETADQMQQHFGDFAQQRLRARAELVEPNRSEETRDDERRMRPTLGEDDRERRMARERFEVPMLEQRRLPKNVFLESVTLPDDSTSRGQIEVVISPLGLDRDVRMKLISEDGDELNVRWDPILGRGFVFSGEWDS